VCASFLSLVFDDAAPLPQLYHTVGDREGGCAMRDEEHLREKRKERVRINPDK